MPGKSVPMKGGVDETEIDVRALAAEQAEQRKMLRALQKLTIRHLKDCGALQLVTAKNLTQLTESLGAIEHRFELFDKVCGFLTKHGKKLGSVVISALIAAYIGVLVQNWMLHRDSAAHADVAANKATAAAAAVQQIPALTVQKLEARHEAVAP